MVRESGDSDAVWDEVVDSNPEESDDDDKDGAVIPFAAAGDGEGGQLSEIKPFVISFCGEGEDVDEKF